MTRGFAVVVLAGGEATRFPGKLEAPFDGVPIVERVVCALRGAGDDLVLSIGSRTDDALAARLGVRAVRDDAAARGPLGGLLAAALALPAPWLFAAPGDAPLLDIAFVRTLWDARADDDDAIVAREGACGRVHPLPAFYRRAALAREAPAVFASGRRSLRALLERLGTRVVEVTPGLAALHNVNTPDELRERPQAQHL